MKKFGLPGSPPPMRGKVVDTKSTRSSTGITPAYAGKSTISGMGDFNDKGSPPPMRGKAVQCGRIYAGHRITPAYAGKSDLLQSKGKED